MTTLESLLDRSQTKSESFYQYDITEIPLKPDEGEMGNMLIQQIISTGKRIGKTAKKDIL
jgi:hypothetical protein